MRYPVAAALLAAVTTLAVGAPAATAASTPALFAASTSAFHSASRFAFPATNTGPISLGAKGCLTQSGQTGVVAASCQDKQTQRWTIGADGTIRVNGPVGECLGLAAGIAALTDCTNVSAQWFPLANYHLENINDSVSPQSRICLAIGLKITTGPCATAAYVVVPGTAYASTALIDRPDSGGSGNWALDTMTRRASVTYLGTSAGKYVYEGSISDAGTFVTFPGADTPNQGLDPGKLLGDALTGNMTGHWGFSFTASAPASATPPSSVTGYGATGTGNWYQLFFTSSTVFAGTGGLASGPEQWSWQYGTGMDNCAATQTWTDANNDGGGQNATGIWATDITAPAPGSVC